MTELVPAADIERIVGARRHRKAHIGRAISDQETVYILHSRECLSTGVDLRECRFSVALDHGIPLARWSGKEDRPVLLAVWGKVLIPAADLSGGDRLGIELIEGGDTA